MREGNRVEHAYAQRNADAVGDGDETHVVRRCAGDGGVNIRLRLRHIHVGVKPRQAQSAAEQQNQQRRRRPHRAQKILAARLDAVDVADIRTDEGNVLLRENFFERLGNGDGIQRVDAGGGWAEEGAMPGFFAAQHFGSIRDMEGFALRELHAGAQLHINHADFSSFLCGISEQSAPEAVPRPVPFEGVGRIGGIRRDAREIRRPAEERTKQGVLRQRGDGKQQHPAEQQGRKCSFHNGFTSADDTVNIPESVRKYTRM